MPAKKKGLTEEEKKQLEEAKKKVQEQKRGPGRPRKDPDAPPKPPPRKDVGPGRPTKKSKEEIEEQRRKKEEAKGKPKGRPKKKVKVPKSIPKEEVLETLFTEEEIKAMEEELFLENSRINEDPNILTEEQLQLFRLKGTLLGPRYEKLIELSSKIAKEEEEAKRLATKEKFRKLAEENARARGDPEGPSSAFKLARDLAVTQATGLALENLPGVLDSTGLSPILRDAADLLLEGQAGDPQGLLANTMGENLGEMIERTSLAGSDWTYEYDYQSDSDVGPAHSAVARARSDASVQADMHGLATDLNSQLRQLGEERGTESFVGSPTWIWNTYQNTFATLKLLASIHRRMRENYPGYARTVDKMLSTGALASQVGMAFYQSEASLAGLGEVLAKGGLSEGLVRLARAAGMSGASTRASAGLIANYLVEQIQEYGPDAINNVYNVFENGEVQRLLWSMGITDIEPDSTVTIEEIYNDEGEQIQIKEGGRVADDNAPNWYDPPTAGRNGLDAGDIIPPAPSTYGGNALPTPLNPSEGENAEAPGPTIIPPGPKEPPGPSTTPDADGPNKGMSREDLQKILVKLIMHIKAQRHAMEHLRVMIEEMKKKWEEYQGTEKQLDQDLLNHYLLYAQKKTPQLKNKVSDLIMAKHYYAYERAIQMQSAGRRRKVQRQRFSRPVINQSQYY